MAGAAFFRLIIGEDATIGKRLIEDRRVPLISATGSTRMGRIVAETVARRLGRTLLELGGNNGVIVMNDANLDLALRAVLFGAVGTAGPALHQHPAAFSAARNRAGDDAQAAIRLRPDSHRRSVGRTRR